MEIQTYRNDYKSIRGKKILVFGLGILGGGVATVNWLLKHGAKLTITDLKNKQALKSSLKKIKGKVRFVLGHHNLFDIKRNKIIVVNPDVSINNLFIKKAIALGKQIENEATIFFNNCPASIVAVTGTRGKTTVVNWINHFLNLKFKSVIAGNSPKHQFLKILDKTKNLDYVVLEVPSFHLEYFNKNIKPPEIAVITNIYQDHLNRYKNIKNYASVKYNLVRWQNSSQKLILNYDNKFTPFLLKKKPISDIYFFSLNRLPKNKNGVFYNNGFLFFQYKNIVKKIIKLKKFEKKLGIHNVENLLISSIVAYLAGCSWQEIKKSINSLPQIPFRQEIIFKNKHLIVINDTAATSPEAGIAAIKRFASPSTILIAGGTDKNLDFKNWAKVVLKFIKLQNIILIQDSALNKILPLMKCAATKITICNSLKECIKSAINKSKKYKKSIILFSPSAKSFGLFKNEYDRGEKFNHLIRNLLNKKI